MNVIFFYNTSFIILVFAITNNCALSQVVSHQEEIYFISDVQEPLPIEKTVMKTYRNEEARDSLFADIIRQHPDNLFLLGDLSSRGSDEEAWKPLVTFLDSLHSENTNVYSIPGNHEYMGRKSVGMPIFKNHFPGKYLNGYFVCIDSIAFVMLNSNFNELGENELSRQLEWYNSEMDSLDANRAVKAIIVCTHHPPYSNSKVVGSSKPVQDKIVPIFEKSKKAILFMSGHSHNLEYFSDTIAKHFLIIGGGGGITQPLIPINKRVYHDLLIQDLKPLYFYLVIEKQENGLKLTARGFKKDFIFFELNIGRVTFN